MAELQEELQRGLGTSYTLEREVGRGGMATVFLARDAKHGRMVALKVLHHDLALTLGPERFRREITIAAQLQHPHILSVFDSGETSAGQLWFTMPYVEGETLHDRLRREGRLPIDEAVGVTRDVASALEYAHQHGVVHRDVKPENILLSTQGDALLADFGIAEALGSTPGPGATGESSRLTQAGFRVGTPAYMSPEQAAGAPVDARTDVFSLGAVCHEMLTGELPGAVSAPRSDVPAPILAVVRRALAGDPAQRYATMAEFSRALASAIAAPRRTGGRAWRATWAIGGGLILGAGALFAWKHQVQVVDHGQVAAVSAALPTVAVLAFENLGDSADGYFADGVTDEIRGKLTSLSGLRVIARSSSVPYKHSAKSLPEIARELGVRYLLTGQVRWERVAGGKSRVRVNPELVEVADGKAPTSRWQRPFDADISDVFDVQADIAGRVASALNVALGADQQQRLAEQPTRSLAAYDAFLKGEAATQAMGVVDTRSIRRGIAFYAEAVRLDSNFVPAWVGLAVAYTGLYFNGARTPADAQAAQQAIERAQALAPDRAETQLAVGNYERYVRLDNGRALAAVERGLRSAPDDAGLLNAASAWESGLGRWDAAVAHGQRALALDPRSFTTARDLGLTLHYLRRYREALAAYDRASSLAPGDLLVQEYRAMIGLSRGDLPAARRVVHEALRTVDTTSFLAFVGNAYDLYWMFDDSLQRRLLTLPPAAFDNDSAAWALVRAQTAWLRGDTVNARAHAAIARRLINGALAATPNDWQHQAQLGLALAFLARKSEAIEHGQRAVALLPLSTDAVIAPYAQQILARIYMMADEPERALDELEPLARIPYFLSPDWLRIDPTWAPLRANPRFQRLVAAEKPIAVASPPIAQWAVADALDTRRLPARAFRLLDTETIAVSAGPNCIPAVWCLGKPPQTATRARALDQ